MLIFRLWFSKSKCPYTSRPKFLGFNCCDFLCQNVLIPPDQNVSVLIVSNMHIGNYRTFWHRKLCKRYSWNSCEYFMIPWVKNVSIQPTHILLNSNQKMTRGWCNVKKPKHTKQLFFLILIYLFVIWKHIIWKTLFRMNEPDAILKNLEDLSLMIIIKEVCMLLKVL